MNRQLRRARSPRAARLASIGLPLAGVLIFLLLWQWLAQGPLSSSNLPYATGTFIQLGHLLGEGQTWSSLGSTLGQAALGFAISAVIAIPVGIVVGTSSLGYSATRVVLDVLKTIPAVVILPIVVLHLGTSPGMSVFLIAFTLIPLLIVTVVSGVRDVDPVMIDAARSYRLGRLARIWRIVLPNSLPFIATGLRVSGSFALVVAVLAEIVGGAPGLGHDLEVYRTAGYLETVFAYVLILGTLGICLNALLTFGERRLIHWHESVRLVVGHRERRSRSLVTDDRVRPWWPVLDRAQTFLHGLRPARRASDAGPGPRGHGPRISERARRWGLRIVTVLVPVALLALWWFGSARSTDPYSPPATRIIDQFRAIWLSANFVTDALPSLRNLIVGLAIAVVAGVGLGALIARVQWLYAMTNPLISFFRSIPAIAYLPLFITVLGFNSGMRVTAIAVGATFPVLLATIDGIRGIDSTLLDVTRSYRLRPMRRLLSVQLPAAAPRIFAGLELSVAAALIVMVASELMGTSQGIGAQLILAQQYFNFTDMWAGVILLALIGIVSNLLFRLARARILAWYDGVRAAGKTS